MTSDWSFTNFLSSMHHSHFFCACIMRPFFVMHIPVQHPFGFFYHAEHIIIEKNNLKFHVSEPITVTVRPFSCQLRNLQLIPLNNCIWELILIHWMGRPLEVHIFGKAFFMITLYCCVRFPIYYYANSLWR